MDILQFFAAYICLFGLVLFLVLLAHISPSFGAWVDNVKRGALRIIKAATPDLLCKAMNKFIHYVFHTRNPLIKILSVVLMFLGNAVYLVEVIPILHSFKREEHISILLAPIALLAITLVTFYLSCVSDPGRIYSESEASVWTIVYKPDGIMFTEGSYCRTCNQLKPARSKHCNLCGYCVQRFDHHCLWTNNCVGGANLRYFLLFLVFLHVMVVHGILRGAEALTLVAKHSAFLEGRFADIKNGRNTIANIYIILENLFLWHPGCTLLVTSLLLLFILIGLLMLYHVTLIFNNQTTNERYKITSVSQEEKGEDNKSIQHKQFKKYDFNQNQRRRSNNADQQHVSNVQCQNKLSKDIQQYNVDYLNTFYNRGIINNINEVLFPRSEYDNAKLRVRKQQR